MYEEVCLLCGRPVLTDGRAYCSDECESIDITSPSISTSSSAQPSPFLHSTTNPPMHLSEVPALLPSALGHSLNTRKSHRVRHSESSSSNSSTSWSALEDNMCDDENIPPILHGANTEDEFYAVNTDYLSVDTAPKPSPSFATAFRHPNSSLAYVRRPSSTNNRSTIPTLHHRTPSASTSGMSRSILSDCPTEDDASDVPSVPPSASSLRSDRRNGRPSTVSVGDVDEEVDREKEQETVTSKSRRNRASLPAYFSLLVSTSTTPRSHKGTSALSVLSRSLHSSSSPPTPRLARPILDTTTAFAMAQSPRVSKEHAHVTDPASRGRSKRRDPDGRSSLQKSLNRSPGAHTHVHQSAHARARLDSMEKVAEWVAHSPVVSVAGRSARHLAQRRNSSPPPLPKFEKMELPDSGVEFDSGYAPSMVEESDDDADEEVAVEESTRGRRRVDELDQMPTGIERAAPGYGNGRSGLLARDRERGRTATVKR